MVAAKRSAPAGDTAVESNNNNIDQTINKLDSLIANSAKKTRLMFSTAYSQAAMDEQERYINRVNFISTITHSVYYSQRVKLTSKIHDEYENLRTLPEALIKQQKEAIKARKAKATTIEEVSNEDDEKSSVSKLIDSIPEKSTMYVILVFAIRLETNLQMN